MDRFSLFVLVLLIGATSPASAATFAACDHYHPLKSGCVVDGDTFWIDGVKIRPVGFDAPEMGPPNCPGPAAGAVAARDRLIELLNSGAVRVEPTGAMSYDRQLAAVSVNGVDIGETLIAEGLARRYAEGEAPWC